MSDKKNDTSDSMFWKEMAHEIKKRDRMIEEYARRRSREDLQSDAIEELTILCDNIFNRYFLSDHFLADKNPSKMADLLYLRKRRSYIELILEAIRKQKDYA